VNGDNNTRRVFATKAKTSSTQEWKNAGYADLGARLLVEFSNS
jgi:hypothetical protein